jgi:ribonuclease P protein component
MNKARIINENRDFRRIYSRGKSLVSSCLVTYVVKNKFGENRIGITTSKKTGNAVHRNRARRVIRAAFGALREKAAKGFDIVFVSRARTSLVKTPVVLKEMEYHLKKLGVLK